MGEEQSERKILPGSVELRDVSVEDLDIFFEHQLDPEATTMAGFPSRERAAFLAHWHRVLGNETGLKQTILYNGQVAGNIVSFDSSGERDVGYWLGKQYWGQGIASRALRLFLDYEQRRPLYAHVVTHNIASRRVLEKAGFVVVGTTTPSSDGPDEELSEYILRLDLDENNVRP